MCKGGRERWEHVCVRQRACIGYLCLRGSNNCMGVLKRKGETNVCFLCVCVMSCFHWYIFSFLGKECKLLERREEGVYNAFLSYFRRNGGFQMRFADRNYVCLRDVTVRVFLPNSSVRYATSSVRYAL